jgi:hypothetical protein
MGVTGAGKPTFIGHLSNDHVKVSDSLESCIQNFIMIQLGGVPTSRCGYGSCSHIFSHHVPKNRRIYFMDIPGFDDTFRKDIDILRNIAGWLGETIWEILRHGM